MSYRETSSTSNYHSLQVQANRRFSRGVQFGAWTWPKAMAYADDDGAGVANFVCGNYGKANYDRTHNSVVNFLWDIPKLGTMWKNRAARGAFDNWQRASRRSSVDSRWALASAPPTPSI